MSGVFGSAASWSATSYSSSINFGMKDFVLHDTIQILTNFAYYPFEHNCFHVQEVLVDCNNVEDGNWMTHDALLSYRRSLRSCCPVLLVAFCWRPPPCVSWWFPTMQYSPQQLFCSLFIRAKRLAMSSVVSRIAVAASGAARRVG